MVLLPNQGFVVIAFKTDNPGNWLMHCHIADHASFGLAAQILERQGEAATIWPSHSEAMVETRRVCERWKNWAKDCRNWWPQDNGTGIFPACKDENAHNPPNIFYPFDDDSGI